MWDIYFVPINGSGVKDKDTTTENEVYPTDFCHSDYASQRDNPCLITVVLAEALNADTYSRRIGLVYGRWFNNPSTNTVLIAKQSAQRVFC